MRLFHPILAPIIAGVLTFSAAAHAGTTGLFQVNERIPDTTSYAVAPVSEGGATVAGDNITVVVNPGDYANDYTGKTVHATLSERADGSMLLHNIYPQEPLSIARLEQTNANLRRDTVERGRRVFRLEDDFIPEFGAWNEEGTVVTDKDFRGKFMIINFIFTRCPTPDMCPAQTMRMARLQRELARAEKSDEVELVSFTLDPEYDSPGVLRDYAETRGLDLANFTLLTAPKPAMEDLYRQFGIVAYKADGTIDHTMGTILVSPKGKILYRKSGSRWSVTEFLKKLEEAQS
ncbi:MAG: SCO family protein [Opitutales bacterium]